jgi:heparosan-N-sulfate-glucuronate 5-epimerase
LEVVGSSDTGAGAMKLYPAPTMVDDEKILGAKFAVMDDSGVVTVNLMSPQGPRKRYVPVTISQFAMANYNMYVKTGDGAYREAMTVQTDWLLRNLSEFGAFGAWRYMYDYSAPGYDCRAPWTSCIAQGQGVSAMIRAHSLSPDARNEKVAKLASRAFEVPVQEGGVRWTDGHGCVWYKEYACSRSSNVLNGMVFGLFGLKECASYFHDGDADRMFLEGVRTLKRHLPDFEVGVYPFFKWSRYDDGVIALAARRYHRIHIRQMEELYRMTGDRFFADYSARWRRFEEVYSRSPVYIAANGLARRLGKRSQLRSLARGRP